MEHTTRDLLLRGEVAIRGRMPWSSNGTYLVDACLDGDVTQAVYKPHRGERPLWDFPGGLYKREVAAYELSAQLGWDLVPLTIVRAEGPLGEGSLQQFVPADFEQHYFTLYETGAYTGQLQAMCVFDLLANNTDRKSGHCLLGEDGRVWGIDNGLTFHQEFKLRTVIWEFAGERLPDHAADDVRRVVAELDGGPFGERIGALLAPVEIDALRLRAANLLRDGLPYGDDHYSMPWPLV
jgi:uncharacterized repeat protein (TIGR03843 family)